MPEIAHFIAYLGTAMGGPVHGMAAYANILAGRGGKVTVFSPSRSSDGPGIRLDSRVRLARSSPPARSPFRHSAALRREVQGSSIELIHSHGLWTDIHRLAGQVARERSLPHLLAPCGMLEPGALRHHRWRKMGVLLWFQLRALRECRCLHAKSLKELADIRQFGLRNPVAVFGNPIPLPPPERRKTAADFRNRLQLAGNSKILLFLGRLHPIKGLPRLFQAWSGLCGRHPEWVLVVAGPEEAGHGAVLRAAAAVLPDQGRIHFTGELDEAWKWAALAAADLFVLPSDFENFGNAIVEAMFCGVPAITTTGTPWKELPGAGAGWCVAPTADALAEALGQGLSLSDQERKSMGERAKTVAAPFSVERTTADLLAVYEWLLGHGTKPKCVHED